MLFCRCRHKLELTLLLRPLIVLFALPVIRLLVGKQHALNGASIEWLLQRIVR